MSAAEVQTAATATARAPTRRMPSGEPPGEPRRIGYLYIAPALVVYAVFLLYPLGRAVQLSFYDWDGLTLGTWAGLANYAYIITDPSLRNRV